MPIMRTIPAVISIAGSAMARLNYMQPYAHVDSQGDDAVARTDLLVA